MHTRKPEAESLDSEYQEIINYITNPFFGVPREVSSVVRDKLIDLQNKNKPKPIKRLSDEQINEMPMESGPNYLMKFARAIEAAHIKLNQEPEEVPFDFEEWNKGGWIAICDYGVVRAEHDRLMSGEGEYKTMRRKNDQ